jgi:DNA polymerase-1
MPDSLYLVDVSSFVFRAYFSVGHLSTRDGTPTGAVFGVANMLIALIADRAPSHLAVAMDSKTPTFRKEIFPEYKANRPPPPPDLAAQFPLVRELIEAFDLPVLQRDGFEADDLIATATRVAREAGLEVVIVSADKDLMQLVGPGVVMLDTMKEKTWDAAAVEEKWGVPPSLLGDLLAIAGDSSDNIPGVPRMGPKTTAPLLLEHGGLEPLLSNLDRLKSRAVAARLADHAGDARLSRRLVTLEGHVPVEVDLGAMRLRPPDPERLTPVLERLELHQLENRLFQGAAAQTPGGPEVEYDTVTDLGDLVRIAGDIRAAGCFAVDLETTSVSAVTAEIVGVALAWKPLCAVYVPVAHRGEGSEACLPLADVLSQNVKYEDVIFRRHGIRIANVAFDPMLASYLLRGDGRSHGLDALAREVLGRGTVTYDEVTEKTRGAQLAFADVAVDRATRYSGEDAEIALALADALAPEIERAGMASLLHDVEIPLARVLTGIELAGVAVDREHLQTMSADFERRLVGIEATAWKLAGGDFNLGSPKQLQEVLFERLALPTQRKTKTGHSTDSEVLEALAPFHPLPGVILEHRLLSKLKGTYLDALPRLVNPATGRIHTSFNQAVTATGRLSSSNPNLQNIPARTEQGRAIRRAFVAAPGNVLVSADYSQIELRILAHLSGDAAMTDAFRSGEDVHARTARSLFGYGAGEEIPRERRAQAKAVNFGVIYGKTDFSLARELGISRGEAKRFIERFFALHEGVARFMDEVIETARRDRAVSTLLGRRRPLRDIDSGNFQARQQTERMARNTPIQGSAADLLKVAMVRVDRRLGAERLTARMILTVHDELVFEVPENEIDRVVAAVREEMTGAMDLAVPLVVDIGTGTNWADAH